MDGKRRSTGRALKTVAFRSCAHTNFYITTSVLKRINIENGPERGDPVTCGLFFENEKQII